MSKQMLNILTLTNGSCASLNRDLTANSTFTLIEHLIILTSNSLSNFDARRYLIDTNYTHLRHEYKINQLNPLADVEKIKCNLLFFFFFKVTFIVYCQSINFIVLIILIILSFNISRNARDGKINNLSCNN